VHRAVKSISINALRAHLLERWHAMLLLLVVVVVLLRLP